MEITYSLVHNAHITAIRIAYWVWDYSKLIKYLHNVPYAFPPLLLNAWATFLLVLYKHSFTCDDVKASNNKPRVLDDLALVNLINFHVSFYK